jgi:hypothetical protein
LRVVAVVNEGRRRRSRRVEPRKRRGLRRFMLIMGLWSCLRLRYRDGEYEELVG